ncbi:OLC1v1014898C2 [Oldenlandia corymbosa var. corymbosa]|nr:OLC1v1014898C2 [Oldenlandia corymbosa var. corymbosa]
MAQLPIKRGLSQFYNGKSDSFTCLSRVTSLEDLAKKESPYNCRRKKNKAVAYRLFTLPRPVISKKNTRGTSLSTSSLRRSFINANCIRPPQIPLHKGFNGG